MKTLLFAFAAPFLLSSVAFANSLDQDQLDAEGAFIEAQEKEIKELERQIAERKTLVQDLRDKFELLSQDWDFLSNSQRQSRLNEINDARPRVSMKRMIERSTTSVVAQKRRVGIASRNRSDQMKREAQTGAKIRARSRVRTYSRGGGSRMAKKRTTSRYRRGAQNVRRRRHTPITPTEGSEE